MALLLLFISVAPPGFFRPDVVRQPVCAVSPHSRPDALHQKNGGNSNNAPLPFVDVEGLGPATDTLITTASALESWPTVAKPAAEPQHAHNAKTSRLWYIHMCTMLCMVIINLKVNRSIT